eukprot:TRINITY_DN14329_c1_g2_i1.p1 TRINITY_DN14329_c1_g2~~TRINITY_DN14329_c1_g2_i1.p1  ORF type:complete len:310 (+),score=37.30 TRINITY_DN14329_c1_g2_i1:36-965(+)
MAMMFTTVKNTFVHVDDSGCFDTSRTSRPMASSALARMSLDVRSLDQEACAATNEKSSAHAAKDRSLEDLLFPPHGDDVCRRVRAHSGPSPFDADVDGMMGGYVHEMEVVDHLWGRPVAQRKDAGMRGGCVQEMEVVDHLWGRPVAERKDASRISSSGVAGQANRNTLSSETEEFNASALADNGSTHRTYVPNKSARDVPARNLFLNTAPLSRSTTGKSQLFSTSPLSKHQDQMGSCRQFFLGNTPVTEFSDPKRDETHRSEERTTVMLMNVPCGYTSSKLIFTIDSEGFAGMYDFIYVPVNFGARSTL